MTSRPKYIFHVADEKRWASAKSSGAYTPKEYDDEGFIHMSTESQLAGVLDRYYSGRSDIVILKIDSTRLSDKFIYEFAESQQEDYPHLYEPLATSAVVSEEKVEK